MRFIKALYFRFLAKIASLLGGEQVILEKGYQTT